MGTSEGTARLVTDKQWERDRDDSLAREPPLLSLQGAQVPSEYRKVVRRQSWETLPQAGGRGLSP